MPTRLSVTKAVKNFSEILGRVRFKGERFVLVKGGKPIAELGPTDAAAPAPLSELPAMLEALSHLEPEDADQFALDLDSGQEHEPVALSALTASELLHGWSR